jgi:hypothetical protein
VALTCCSFPSRIGGFRMVSRSRLVIRVACRRGAARMLGGVNRVRFEAARSAALIYRDRKMFVSGSRSLRVEGAF